MTTTGYETQPPFERPHGISNERKVQAIGRVGQAVSLAVEKFMIIGEIIAEDNPEIKTDMYESCKDARGAGKSIERLCDITRMDDMDYLDAVSAPPPLCDQGAIVIAARSLLSAITRILLLVDIVVVKQLLTAKKKIAKSLHNLQSVVNFTEFVRAFSVFGIEMVELAYLTGQQQQHSLKEERRRAQMFSARQILERSITILLTSSKASLVHSECGIAKENRDTVFCQIRRAMDLIHFVVKDSIFDSTYLTRSDRQPVCYRSAERGTVYAALRHFTQLMEGFRQRMKSNERALYMGNNNYPKTMDINWSGGGGGGEGGDYMLPDCGSIDRKVSACSVYSMPPENVSGGAPAPLPLQQPPPPLWLSPESLPLYSAKISEQLLIAFEKLLEKTHDFTDSAYTSQENRENILILCDRCKLELNKYLHSLLRTELMIDEEIDSVLAAVKSLSEQLVLSVADQVQDLYHSLELSVELVNSFHGSAVAQDLSRLHECANRFHDYCDHIIDVCKLLQHIAYTETLQVQAKCLAINLRIYGPQVLSAAKVLAKYPASSPANENFDAFADMWKWLTAEITTMVKQILDTSNELNEQRAGYLNLPPTVAKAAAAGPLKSYQGPSVPGEEVAKGAFNDLELKDGAAGEVNPYSEKWNDDLNDNNDILKRAKNMSSMAFSMYQFTKGSGTLRTTQDLFTQAEYFAEEANRLYKVLRQFSYQVPASQNKKDLLSSLDRVPTFVQTLQFTVKEHTVGKAATFVKVDHVIRETKNLMSVINKVVTKCFECADKYKLDFTGLAGGIQSGMQRGDDSNNSGMGDSKGTASSTEGSM